MQGGGEYAVRNGLNKKAFGKSFKRTKNCKVVLSSEELENFLEKKKKKKKLPLLLSIRHIRICSYVLPILLFYLQQTSMQDIMYVEL